MARYGTVDQLTTRILIDPTSMTVEAEQTYGEILDAISSKIDNFCRKPDGFFSSEPSEKLIAGTGRRYLPIPNSTEIVSVAVKSSATVEEFQVWENPTSHQAGDGDWYATAGLPTRPVFSRIPYTTLFVSPNGNYFRFTQAIHLPTVKINAYWGVATSVPPEIREACLAEATILLKRYEGTMDSSLTNAELGILSMRARLSQLSRDVKDLLVDSGWVAPLYGGDL